MRGADALRTCCFRRYSRVHQSGLLAGNRDSSKPCAKCSTKGRGRDSQIEWASIQYYVSKFIEGETTMSKSIRHTAPLLPAQHVCAHHCADQIIDAERARTPRRHRASGSARSALLPRLARRATTKWLVVSAVVVAGMAGAGAAYAATAGATAAGAVNSTTSDVVVSTSASKTLSKTGGAAVTIASVTLPQGSWVLTLHASLVNFGPSDYTRCSLYTSSTNIGGATATVGNPVGTGSMGPAAYVSTISFATAIRTSSNAAISIRCYHDSTNGSAPYVDGGASLVAHRSPSLSIIKQ